jgi:PGF-CTERM protein
LLLVASIVATVAVLGAAVSPVAADQHTYDEAPDLTEKADFTINFPFPRDHYPGDMNEENGSIEYYASGADAYREVGAEEGIWADTIVISADWIDYSACSTDNTKTFGVDRGNNNSGTETDEGLLEHRYDDNFRDDGLDVYFYDWEQFAGDPPYLAPEDAIVAAQGAGSDSGPCLTLTSEPGWYQMQGFLNGTIANGDCTEEGNADCEPENKEWVGVKLKTNYMYVCECDDAQEARDELGDPPNESNTPTPTETSTGTDERTPTDTEGGDDPTPTPTEGGGDPTATPTGTQGGGGTVQATATQANNNNDGGGALTPTADEAPGFGPVAALLALLATALLANRRR